MGGLGSAQDVHCKLVDHMTDQAIAYQGGILDGLGRGAPCQKIFDDVLRMNIWMGKANAHRDECGDSPNFHTALVLVRATNELFRAKCLRRKA